MTAASTRTLAAAVLLLTGGAMLMAGCSSGRRRPAAVSPTGPKVLTVPAIERMVQMGTAPSVIQGEIQRSGTVYNLTAQQTRDLRAVGVPPALIGQMQQTYQHAVRKNPQLSKSGSYWVEMDGYWYGGLPFGWPSDWVAGTPPAGRAKR